MGRSGSSSGCVSKPCKAQRRPPTADDAQLSTRRRPKGSSGRRRRVRLCRYPEHGRAHAPAWDGPKAACLRSPWPLRVRNGGTIDMNAPATEGGITAGAIAAQGYRGESQLGVPGTGQSPYGMGGGGGGAGQDDASGGGGGHGATARTVPTAAAACRQACPIPAGAAAQWLRTTYARPSSLAAPAAKEAPMKTAVTPDAAATVVGSSRLRAVRADRRHGAPTVRGQRRQQRRLR